MKPLPIACLLVAIVALPLKADFPAWRESYFTAQELADGALEATLWGETADPDKDGLLNLAEYAFDGNPRLADKQQAPTARIGMTEPELVFQKVRADIQYRVEYSTAPGSDEWSSAGLDAWHASLDAAGEGTLVSIAFSELSPDARFARVLVREQAPPRMPIGTNFWNIRWGYGRGEYFRPAGEIDWATVTNPWNDRFLRDIAIYSVFRFMDQVPTNNSSVRTWSQRTLPTADHYQTSGGAVAYEWQIDLCNRIGADMWITVPHLTVLDYLSNPSDNYWTRLAALVKQRLDPGLRVYVEYSNETWNSGFSQSTFCSQQGLARGFSSDADLARFYYHVYAAVRLHKVFLDTFADDPERIVKVIACQANNFLGTRAAMRAINGLRDDNTPDPSLNPDGIIPDYVAIANYISTADGATADIRTAWANALTNGRSIYRLHQREIQRAGHSIPFIAYEGGQHYLLNADKFSRNPESYDMYREWLDMVAEYFELTMHYTHLGKWASGGAWGAKDSNTQPASEAHRYRALLDYIEGR